MLDRDLGGIGDRGQIEPLVPDDQLLSVPGKCLKLRIGQLQVEQVFRQMREVMGLKPLIAYVPISKVKQGRMEPTSRPRWFLIGLGRYCASAFISVSVSTSKQSNMCIIKVTPALLA